MRVEEYTRKNVVFIGTEAGGRFTPVGTGCVGAVPLGDMDFMWLVTANHVLDQIAGDKFFVRLNRKSGGCETVPLLKADAIRDLTNDLAVISVNFGNDVYDHWSIRFSRKEMENFRSRWAPGIGDEVTAVGLYTSHFGQEKNIPVVRIGHIALMPEEPVRTGVGYVEAYLIEIKSIAGLSGSPVYLNIPRLDARKEGIRVLPQALFDFLGILVGYHVVESKEDQISVPQFQEQSTARTAAASGPPAYDERNTGFAVVIPFERILEILEHEKVVKVMNEARDEHLKKGWKPAAAGVQEAVPTAQDDANPDHLEDFTALLGAAAKGRSPKDQT